MLTTQKILHIVILFVVSLIYSSYIVQLLHPSGWSLLFLTLYCFIFLIYILKTYAIFHYPPTQPTEQLPQYAMKSIFKYKMTADRKKQLQQMLRSPGSDRKALLEEYVSLHKTPSFCDVCENVQPPRTQHCPWCNACIVGKHYHSVGVGYCIGGSNQVAFLMYILVSSILLGFVFCSLILAQFLSGNFQKLHIIEYLFFYLFLLFSLLGCMIYLSDFMELWALLFMNQTYIERNHYILGKIPLYPQSKEQHNYSAILGNLIKLDQLGQVSSWISQAELQIEE